VSACWIVGGQPSVLKSHGYDLNLNESSGRTNDAFFPNAGTAACADAPVKGIPRCSNEGFVIGASSASDAFSKYCLL
jgi:hypothetical protein